MWTSPNLEHIRSFVSQAVCLVQCMWPCALIAHENMHPTFVSFLLVFIFFYFEAFPYWKKRWPQLFCLMYFFFIFSHIVFKNGQIRTKIVKISLPPPGWRNMKLMNKSHKIKKFWDILQIHIDQQRPSGLPKAQQFYLTVHNLGKVTKRVGGMDWARGPQWSARDPPLILSTMQNVGAVRKRKVAQNGVLNWFIMFGGFKIGPGAHSVGPQAHHWSFKQCRIWV